MVPERLSQLLTAYIDGELNDRQRQAVQRLLAKSAEARALLQQLQGHANVLRSLPRRKLHRDFSQQVLRTIAERRLRVSRRAALTHRPGLPAWAGLAVAASVLFVVGIGTYFYFAASNQLENVRALAQERENTKPRERKNPAPEPAASVKEDPILPKEVKPRLPEQVEPPAKVVKEKPPVIFGPELPKERSKNDPLDSDFGSASPTPKMEVFEKVANPRLSLVLQLKELEKLAQQERLRDKLKEDSAFLLALGCLESNRGFERLQAAMQAQGIKMVVDAYGQARLSRKLTTHFLFYSENMTAEELAKILQQLGGDEQKPDAKRTFDRLVVTHLTPSDRKELSMLLGAEVAHLPPINPSTPLGVDIRKPISAGTADQVIKNLEGKGTPRPEPGKPVVIKPPERLVLVLPYNPVRTSPASSKEVKQFLDSRTERRPGTIQVLLILRGPNG